MPTQEEIMQKVLTEGGNLNDVQAALSQAAPAAQPAVQPAAEPAQPVAEPAAPDYGNIPSEYHAEVEALRRKWESGATPKFQRAAEWDAFNRSLQTNPKGTLLYLKEKLGVQLAEDEPRRAAPPSAVQASEDPYASELASIRDRMKKAASLEEYTDLTDKLTDLKAARIARASVQPVQQAVIQQVEEQEIRTLESDPDVRANGINVRQLYPQIKRLQQEVAANPYVKPSEAFYILTGKQALSELAQAKATAARPKVTPAEKAAGTVAGGGAAAPQGTAVLSPLTETWEQMQTKLLAAGFRPD